MAWPSAGVQAGTVAVALLVSALTCWFWLNFATARNIADAPGQRRMHRQVTPRGGGVGIALVVLLALAWLGHAAPSPQPGISGMLAGIFLAALAGLLDDFRRIGTAGKFLLQIAAAALIAATWFQPGWPTIVLALLAGMAVLVLINFWNFMDGANGMAAMQGLLVSIFLALTASQPAPRLLALALMASTAGFLPFNLPKARLFMGDVGSHVVGACVAALLLWEWEEGDIGLFQAFILISAFSMDAGLTLARRIIRGRRFWRAHREHLYQMAIRKGFSHSQVCLAYAAWTGVAGLLVLAIAGQSASLQAAAAGAVALTAAVIQFNLRSRWLARVRPRRAAP